ncbi:MAG TPA: tyrosine-type recombinase/integrase [Thermomicrobiales bacterium]|nr:tyrosine-type recombinase/integrase [Thermomicrobiales bacterium]
MEEMVERFLGALKAERGFSVNTIAAYRNDLHQFIAYLGAPPEEDRISAVTAWQDLNDAHLDAFLLQLRSRDYAPSTVARKTAALKSFCGFLRKQGEMATDIGTNLSSPKVDKYVPKAISHDDVLRLLEQPFRETPNRPESIRDRAMLEVLYGTGMRVSELVALDVADADLGRGEIRCQGKAGRSRVVPLTPRAAESIHAYCSQARGQLVRDNTSSLFVNHRGGRLTRQGFWLILKSYAERAGIDAITPHTLRHSYAIHALRNGAELRDIQQRLGHVSIGTTQVYRDLAARRDSAPIDIPPADTLGEEEPTITLQGALRG